MLFPGDALLLKVGVRGGVDCPGADELNLALNLARPTLSVGGWISIPPATALPSSLTDGDPGLSDGGWISEPPKAALTSELDGCMSMPSVADVSSDLPASARSCQLAAPCSILPANSSAEIAVATAMSALSVGGKASVVAVAALLAAEDRSALGRSAALELAAS